MLVPWLLVAGTVAIPQTWQIDRPAGPEWAASMQVGLGARGEDATALFRPRLTHVSSRGALKLSAPLFLRMADRPPQNDEANPDPHSPSWEVDWDDPELYLGLLEQLLWVSQGRAFQFHAATLSQQTLGHGALLDHYEAVLEPLRPRTGARVDLGVDSLVLTAMLDGLIQPQVVGAMVGLAPLRLFDQDPEERWHTGLTAVADLKAPRTEGSAPVGGLDLNVTYAAYRGQAFTIETYAASVFLSRPAWGAHAGLLTQWQVSNSWPQSLTVGIEAVAAGRNYVPGYFDEAYAGERAYGRAAAGTPKAEENNAAAVGGRARIEGRLGPVEFGCSGTTFGSLRPASAAVYSMVNHAAFSVAVSLTQRWVREASDLLRMGDTSALRLAGSLLIHDNIFVFTHAQRLLRGQGDATAHPETLWLMGLGYGSS